MKHWFVVLISGLLLVAAAGCQTAHSSASSAAVGAVECAFEAQYIRTNGYHDDIEYPTITRISSQKELEDYYESAGLRYDFEHAYSGGSFADAMEKYDATFFEDQTLVLVRLEEPSGSIRHRVTSVSTENGVTTIAVGRYSPEAQTCDMAEWHIFVELRRDQVGEKLQAQMSETLGTMEEYEASY